MVKKWLGFFVFHRLEIGFNNSRVQSGEWKKSTSSAASTPFPGSLSHSAGRVGENPGNEVAAGSSLISGGGGWRGETEFVSFFFSSL